MEKIKLSDPISDLPAEVRQRIFSFLPTSDAIRMSELSYAWRYDWIYLPFFDFGHQFWMSRYYSLKNQIGVHRYHTSDYSKKRKLNDETLDLSLRYAQFLDQFLLLLKTQKRDEPLKLRIYLPCDFGLDDNSVSMDLDFTFGDELQGLSDYFRVYTGKHIFRVRYCLFNLPRYLSASSKFLTQLNLCGGLWGNMLKGMSTQSQFQFQFLNLKKLCITDLYLNQRVVEMLLGSCSNTVLEDLIFARCSGEIFLPLSGYYKLRLLHIEGPPHVTYETPELRLTVMVSSNSLQHLLISNCHMSTLEIDTPNLLFFSYEMSRTRKFLPNFMKILMDPPHTCLRLSPHHYADLWHSKVVDFLAKFSDFQSSFKISWNADKSLIIPQYLRESTSPPLWRVKHLHIEQLFPLVLMPFTESDICNYLDTALWLSPHPRSISLSVRTELSNQGSWSIKIEFQYKEGKNEIYESGCACYSSQPIKCWRHSMMGFRIRNKNGHQDVAAIVTKFFNNSGCKLLN